LPQCKKNINQAVESCVKYFELHKEISENELSILLTGDEFIQDINKQTRGFDKPTNVLSFPNMDFVKGELLSQDFSGLFGEMIFSFETIEREVKEQNKDFFNHLTHLSIHSVLHLLGFDHIEENDAEEMENIEIEILKEMGIDNPYK